MAFVLNLLFPWYMVIMFDNGYVYEAPFTYTTEQFCVQQGTEYVEAVGKHSDHSAYFACFPNNEELL